MERAEYRLRAYEFFPRGEKHGGARLSDDTVRQIRANAEGLTAREWALKLGVHYRTIEKVRQFESWSHVKEKANAQ